MKQTDFASVQKMSPKNLAQILESLASGRLQWPLCLRERGGLDGRRARGQKARSAPQGADRESFFDGHAWVGYRTYVKLVRENAGAHRPYQVRGPDDVHRAFAKLSECDRERFYAASLDSQSHICGVELVSQGSTTSCLVHPREVYKAAILSNAAGVIAIHNHPSGDPTPSADDRAVTRQLVEVGRLLDIPLYDHVVIGHDRYVSFAEAGLL